MENRDDALPPRQASEESRQVRIAIIIEKMDATRGGREKSTAQIADHLASRGHDVTILCQIARAGEDVKVIQMGKRGLTRRNKIAAFVSAVGDHIRREHYDVTHSMLPIPGADVYQPRGGTIPGQIEGSCRRWGRAGWLRRRVFEPVNFHRNKLREYERVVADDAHTLCLAVSQMVADEFADHYGRTENVLVVPNGVDIPELDDDQRANWRQHHRFRLGVGADDPVFICVATNFALKGVDPMIRAFAKWNDLRHSDSNARLLVIGRESTEGYQRIAGLLGVGSKVIFLPPTDNVFEWYSAADACVLLSHYDPCSRTVLEAVRWGVPSITTAHNGACELISDGAGVVVSNAQDRWATVEAFELLSDPKVRGRMSQRCDEISDQLSMDRHVDRLLEAYAGGVTAK